ncbi:MAG: 2-succinyl-5-enolpyruvyl-6-hydroxy-3-cyclohexene-1-carboxylic-acid synthase [Flavobacteriaceae bacterium]|nr:2-succinyl-5-enolpyruvyl-6-hydroxy-3-cyclohexene-1-carboxylic-acid synthase [Flavobacteriaceae bacterium]
MNYTVLNQLPAIAYAYGVRRVVICPGSRSAPLALSFSWFGKMECISVADERSAAFMALGMAQETNAPVVLICTSGTAALNFYPAIAEAYYRNIQLLILTADRPKEWIDRLDGQTIRQNGIFEKHIRQSISLEEKLYENEEAFSKLIDSAIQLSLSPLPGPVHINFPFSEPFYPDKESPSVYPAIEAKQIQQKQFESETNLEIETCLRPLIVVGQHQPNGLFQNQIADLATQLNCPILADVCSNVQHPNVIHYQDAVLRNADTSFAPDLIISCGGAFTSKIVKQFLRSNSSQTHIRVYPDSKMGEPFGNVTYHIHELKQLKNPPTSDGSYLSLLKEKQKLMIDNMGELMGRMTWSEMKAVELFIRNYPNEGSLHVANSMPVRWVDIFRPHGTVKIYANRGTSGIDGCNSTAVGASLVGNGQHVLLTGDMAFFYDINGLWLEHLPANLKIVVLNNQGGGIFRLIDGPKQLPELESLFEMKHNRTAEGVADMFGIEYMKAENEAELTAGLKQLWARPTMCILEVFTDPEQNGKVFESYRQL